MLVKVGIPSQGLAKLFVCWLLILVLTNVRQGPHLTWKVSWGTRLTNVDTEGNREVTLDTFQSPCCWLFCLSTGSLESRTMFWHLQRPEWPHLFHGITFFCDIFGDCCQPARICSLFPPMLAEGRPHPIPWNECRHSRRELTKMNVISLTSLRLLPSLDWLSSIMRRDSTKFENYSIFTELQKTSAMRFLKMLSLCIFLLTVYCYKPSWTMMFHMYMLKCYHQILPGGRPKPGVLFDLSELPSKWQQKSLRTTSKWLPQVFLSCQDISIFWLFQGLLLESSEMQVHAGFKPRERALQVLILTKRNPHQDK